MPPAFGKFFNRYIEQWTKTFCKKTGRPGRSQTGRPAGQPAGQPEMILKFTGRVGSRKSWPVPSLTQIRRFAIIFSAWWLWTSSKFSELEFEKFTGTWITENSYTSADRPIASVWRCPVTGEYSKYVPQKQLIVSLFLLFIGTRFCSKSERWSFFASLSFIFRWNTSKYQEDFFSIHFMKNNKFFNCQILSRHEKF